MSSAVDKVSDNLAAATITDSKTTGTTGESNNNSVDVAEGRRLYIGNLAYATDEGALNDFFKGYLVESTSIPTNPRTGRAVGYAFVDLSTATEAQRAISELSGKEVLSRKVSVQLAKRPDATEKQDGTSGGEGVDGGEGRRRTSGRGRGRGGRGRGGRGGRVGGQDAPGLNENGVLPLQDNTTQAASAQNVQAGATKEAGTGEAAESGEKAPRQPRQRGPPEDGVASKTKVMVANLPYDLTEAKLKELFAAYNPVSAKLALRPIPRFMVKKLQARGEARKGRGFGFVSLENEEQQQKAVKEMNGKEIEGREIAVKVAIDSPGKEDEVTGIENGTPATETPDAAPATTTTA